MLDKERAEVTVANPKSLKLNVDRTGFYRIDYRGPELQSLVWASKLSGRARDGPANDACAALNAGRMTRKESQGLLGRFLHEEAYLAALWGVGSIPRLHPIRLQQ